MINLCCISEMNLLYRIRWICVCWSLVQIYAESVPPHHHHHHHTPATVVPSNTNKPTILQVYEHEHYDPIHQIWLPGTLSPPLHLKLQREKEQEQKTTLFPTEEPLWKVRQWLSIPQWDDSISILQQRQGPSSASSLTCIREDDTMHDIVIPTCIFTSSPTEIQPPAGYDFGTSDWKIDVSGTLRDDHGWYYWVEYFIHDTTRQVVTLPRRRRRWIRSLQRVSSTTTTHWKDTDVLSTRPETTTTQTSRFSLTVASSPIPTTTTRPAASISTHHHHRRPSLLVQIPKQIQDSFNFKGYGISLYQNALWNNVYPRLFSTTTTTSPPKYIHSYGVAIRLPLSSHFSFLEERPYIPILSSSFAYHVDLSTWTFRVSLDVSMSLPTAILLAGIFFVVEYIQWCVWVLRVVISQALLYPLYLPMYSFYHMLQQMYIQWVRGVGSSSSTPSSLEQGSRSTSLHSATEEYQTSFETSILTDNSTEESTDSTQMNLHEDESDSDSEEEDTRATHARITDKTHSTKSTFLYHGFILPTPPILRPPIYPRGILDRVGVGISWRYHSVKGYERKWSWFHMFIPTLHYLVTALDKVQQRIQSLVTLIQMKIQSFVRHLFLLQKESRKSMSMDSTIMFAEKSSSSWKNYPTHSRIYPWLRQRICSMGLSWGGFNPETPILSCSAVMSLSGFTTWNPLSSFFSSSHVSPRVMTSTTSERVANNLPAVDLK